MLRLLNRFRADLGVAASAAELEATARATVRQLQQDTATVSLSEPRVDGNRLAFDVGVTNLTGHKFPTGYPSRRTWLHVTVRDARGGVVFESGAIRRQRLDRRQRQRPRPRRPTSPTTTRSHRPTRCRSTSRFSATRSGKPTTGLLTATQYLKDNRLLPRGFDKATAPAEIAVAGGARQDADFGSGGDRVRYRVPVTGAGPYRVEVELRYQSIGYRWASNLESVKADEPVRFVQYYQATVQGSSVVVASATR